MAFALWQSKTAVLSLLILGSATLVLSDAARRELRVESRRIIVDPDFLSRFDHTARNDDFREENAALKWRNFRGSEGRDLQGTPERYKRISQRLEIRDEEGRRFSERFENFNDRRHFSQRRDINNRKEERRNYADRLANDQQNIFAAQRGQYDREDRQDKQSTDGDFNRENDRSIVLSVGENRGEYTRNENRRTERQQPRNLVDAREQRGIESERLRRQLRYHNRRESRFDMGRSDSFTKADLIEDRRRDGRIEKHQMKDRAIDRKDFQNDNNERRRSVQIETNRQRFESRREDARFGDRYTVEQRKQPEFETRYRGGSESGFQNRIPQTEEIRVLERRSGERRDIGNSPFERLPHEVRQSEHRFDNGENYNNPKLSYNRHSRQEEHYNSRIEESAVRRSTQFSDRDMEDRTVELRTQKLERIRGEIRRRESAEEERKARSATQCDERKKREQMNLIFTEDQRSRQEARIENRRYENQKAVGINERTIDSRTARQEVRVNRRLLNQQEVEENVRNAITRDSSEEDSRRSRGPYEGVRNDNRHSENQDEIKFDIGRTVVAELLEKEIDNIRRIGRSKGRIIDHRSENRKGLVIDLEVRNNKDQTYRGDEQRAQLATRFDKRRIHHRHTHPSNSLNLENRENFISTRNHLIFSINRVLLTLAQGMLLAYLVMKTFTYNKAEKKNRLSEIVEKSTAAIGF